MTVKLTFDEGSGVWDIMQFKGAGMVGNVPASDPSRKGNKYLVIRCTNRELARRTWRKAITIKSCWDTGKTASYGIRKLLNSSAELAARLISTKSNFVIIGEFAP